jgi:hypothetical protein
LQIKTEANELLWDALACTGSASLFNIESGNDLNGEPSEDEPCASIEYRIIFEYGNCRQSHAIIIGYSEEDGVGLEFGEDGDILPITCAQVMQAIYFDLALTGLEDKYLQ